MCVFFLILIVFRGYFYTILLNLTIISFMIFIYFIIQTLYFKLLIFIDENFILLLFSILLILQPLHYLHYLLFF